MAASKKTAKAKGDAGEQTAMAVSTAAFKHGAAAYGARYVKKGFGFDEQEDLEWALGWPHVRRLIDGHPHDVDPLANWIKHYAPFPGSRMDFPREVAARMVRMFKFLPATPEDASKQWALAKEHIETPGHITEDEARSIIRLQLPPVQELWWLFNFPQAILLMEAFVGPLPVAEAMVEAIEAWPPEVLKASSAQRFNCVSTLGFVLLRVPDASRAGLEARLRRVLPPGLGSVEGEPFYLAYRALERVLSGKQAALNCGRMLIPTDLLFVDDPGFVLESMRARESKGPGDYPALARLTFIAGDAMLDLEAKWWKKYTEPNKDDAQRNFVRDYGRIRHEKMLSILLAMTSSSKARKEAAAWFAAHGDYARPYLQRAAAGSGDEATWAKAILG